MTKTKTPPKKSAVNPQHKLLSLAMKKTMVNNAVLPILEDILFTPGFAAISDLENSVVVPFTLNGLGRKTVAIPGKRFLDVLEMLPELTATVDKNFAVDFVQGARKIKLTGDNPDNFPIIRLTDKDYPSVGRLTAADMEQLKTSLDFVSNDDLRPAMTGVFFEVEGIDKNSRIVATDAHRLFWHPLEGKLEKEFILPQKTAKILLALGGEWDISSDNEPNANNENYIRFTREDGAKVICRIIDARFPDYKVVVPEGEGLVKLISSPEFLLKEFKNAGKFANKSTSQVTLGLNVVFSMSSQEVDFGEEYRSEFQNKAEVEFGFSPDYPKQYTLDGNSVKIVKDHGSIVEIAGEYSYSEPIKVAKKDLVELSPSLYIGFNAEFMQDVISKTPKDSPVTIEMWSPTKCAIINKHFLIMPLMLNS